MDNEPLISNSELKDVIDLRTLLEEMAKDRPNLAVILKGLHIENKTCQNMVITAASSCSITRDFAAITIANELFKAGVTIGYKYAMAEYMEKEFGDGTDRQVG